MSTNVTRNTLLGLRPAETKTTAAALPFRSLTLFQKSAGLTGREVASLLGWQERTLYRRKEEGCITRSESEKLRLAALVFAEIVGAFDGNMEKARVWIRKPAMALGGRTPLALLGDGEGALEVSRLAVRIDRGVYT